jgi:DNA-binding transcriptional LysR family regulator
MDRLIRLGQLWSWLPAFRAVAETEHVHQAAARLHLTPSALSRSIRLLEEDVGQALFRRVGRSLELTDAGHELLRALREAMRRLDDALVTVTQKPTMRLRVAAEDALALAVIIDALDSDGAPELVAATDDARAQLLRGSIDVAFVSEPCAGRDVLVVKLGELDFSARVSRDGRAAFIDAPGLPWPPERERVVDVRVNTAALALAACRAGLGIAVLPDAIAYDLSLACDDDGEPLARLRRPVYAMRRAPLGNCRDAAATLVESVRARLQQPVREIAMDGLVASA